ncbi:MAG: protein yceH [Gemmatimonadetes bacterium]|nr:protein yceH [Gemmatimonadota bacterium]
MLSPTQLTAVEVRILGSLVEKETTTPDVYPLSLNALVNACNQTSNRDPVMELAEDAVRWAINNLRQQSLVRAVQRSDSRVMKYQHLMTETMSLDAPGLAVMCVLMLRGPQTVGEIKGRTGRLNEFASLSDVDETLAALAARELVVELPRRPGQKEVRYAHLLSGAVEASVAGEERAAPTSSTAPFGPGSDRIAALEATVEELRRQLADLQERFDAFKGQFG